MTLAELLWIVVLAFTPGLELRAAIPYAILVAGWSPLAGGIAGTIATIALAPVLWFCFNQFMAVVLRVPALARLWEWASARSVRKLDPVVKKYGVYGLAIFIGVPLPGTGVVSACIAAWVLRFRFRDFLLSSALGCVIAGAIVTAVVASGSEAFRFMYKAVEP